LKIDRLVSIIMILLERKKISAPELAKMFEVNIRTIYRDIDTINQAGYSYNYLSWCKWWHWYNGGI
jgi:Predicted transcriptional regulator